MKKPKVLHCIDHLGTGGAQEIVWDLSKLLSSTYETHVAYIFNKPAYAEKITRAGVPVHFLGGSAEYTFISALNPMPLVRLLRLVAREKYDIVHVHLYVASLYSIFIKLVSPHTRIVNSIHAPRRVIPNIYLHYPLVRFVTDQFIAEYDSTVSDLIRFGVSKARVELIHFGSNVVDNFKASQTSDIRPELDIPPSAPVLVSIARLSPERHVDVFLKMWVKVVKNIPEALFLIVGDGPEEARLKKLAQELHIEKSVRFAGWRGDLPALLQAVNVYVTVFEDADPMSIAAIQAWVYGVPVVGYNIGDHTCADVRTKGEFLVSSSDVRELAAETIALLKNPDQAKKAGEAGYVHAQKMYSVHGMISAHDALYQKLLTV